jgi:hypothetical protein
LPRYAPCTPPTQDFNWTNILKRKLPEGFNAEVRDHRKVRGRYDDISMIIRHA